MIQINLLPEEFRVKEKKGVSLPALKIVVGVSSIFILLTVIFYVDFILSTFKLRRLEAKWKEIQPQSRVLEQLRSEVEGDLKKEYDFMKSFVTTERPLANILVWASEFLPPTAWLTEVNLQHSKEAETLLIKGLCLPSKEKSSIEYIEDYLNHLKGKMPDAAITLTTNQQKMSDVEITQFIANFDWGGARKP